jgi:hypothetical protein
MHGQNVVGWFDVLLTVVASDNWSKVSAPNDNKIKKSRVNSVDAMVCFRAKMLVEISIPDIGNLKNAKCELCDCQFLLLSFGKGTFGGMPWHQ